MADIRDYQGGFGGWIRDGEKRPEKYDRFQDKLRTEEAAKKHADELSVKADEADIPVSVQKWIDAGKPQLHPSDDGSLFYKNGCFGNERIPKSHAHVALQY